MAKRLKRLKYFHRYHQCNFYGIICATKQGGVHTSFKEALQIIKGVYNLTRGLKQIVHLVGWQYDGHDSKYPAWFEVNKGLKRPEDETALESLLWLMKAARKYNAVVTLHINMEMAIPNSPLWDEYVAKDILYKNPDGSLLKLDIWGGEQTYGVCKTREWQAGLAQKRIDRLLKMIPLQKSATVHLDQFRPVPSPFHGITLEQEMETAKKIIMYWYAKGINVTTEFLGYHELVGYIPLVWHLNLDEASRLKYPASLICGGGSSWNCRRRTLDTLSGWSGSFCVPEAGCLYEEAWGHAIDQGFSAQKNNFCKTIEAFAPEFCEKTLIWLFLNRQRPLEHRHTRHSYEVFFSNNVISRVTVQSRHLAITQRGRMLVDGHDCFVPVVWRKGECIAYSRDGCDRKWELPEDWCNSRQVRIAALSLQGPTRITDAATINGCIRLKITPGQMLVVKKL